MDVNRETSYRFIRFDSLPEAIRGVALTQTNIAIHALTNNEVELHTGVHEARKCFKKIRSLLRLIRTGMNESIYHQENDRFRYAGHQLSALRDAQVTIETFDQLLSIYSQLEGNDLVCSVRAQHNNWMELLTIDNR